MRVLQIPLTEPAYARLQVVVDRYNRATDRSLSVEEWAIEHLKEMAIAAELQVALVAIEERETNEAAEHRAAAIETERQRQLALLDDEGAAIPAVDEAAQPGVE